MPDPASPADSIERFAELIALEDDGYTPRPAILSAAGVPAQAWRLIERSWMERLAAGDDPDLALRFAKRYGLTRWSFLSCDAQPAAPAEGSSSEARAADADDAASQATPPGGEPPVAALDVDDTIDDAVPGASARPAADAVEPPGAPLQEDAAGVGDAFAPAPQTLTALRPPMDPADSTLICPLDAVPNEPLPFVLPVPPPGKRLAFYDTQTGAQLEKPVLIDAPPSSQG